MGSRRRRGVLRSRMDAFSTLLSCFIDAQGALKYPVEDVEHVIPWMLVNLPVDLGSLDEDTLVRFAQTCDRAGVTSTMDAAQIRATLDAWYQENPPAAAVVAAIQEAWRQVHEGTGPAPFAGFLGEKRSSGVLGGGERPAGTVPGAMARLAAITPKKSG